MLDSDRLSIEIWMRRLDWISGHLESNDTPIEHLLRHAYRLSFLIPSDIAEMLGFEINEDRIERCIDDGEYDAAAKLLLGDLRVCRLTLPDGYVALLVYDVYLSGWACGRTFAEAALRAWIARLIRGILPDESRTLH